MVHIDFIGMEINAYFGSRYIGAVIDGAAATGSVEIVGTPAAASGTVEAVGPAAEAATGVLTVVGGAGAAATGTVEFTGVPAAASGNITVNGDGDEANVIATIPGGESLARATIVLNGTPEAGDAAIGFQVGTQATANIRPNTVTISDGDQVLLSSGGGTTGIAPISELFTARTTPVGANDFQAGTITTALQSLETVINGLGVATAYSATYFAPAGGRLEITTKQSGTGLNRARNAGGNIITVVGFTVSIPADLEFTGGTDSVPAGTTVQITDLTGATNTVTAVLSGSGAGANQFETFGSDDTTRDNVATAFTALAIGSFKCNNSL